MLTLLRERQAKASGGTTREGDGDAPAGDSWSTLSPAGRSRAAALFEKGIRLIGELNDAQAANVSTLRAEWINTLVNVMLVQVNDLDADGQIPFVEHALDDYAMQIARRVAEFGSEWAALERRYIEERDWLLFQKVDEATFAANRLDELYTEARARIDGAAAPYVTGEDFGALKQAMNTRSHVALGELQVSRNRAHDVHDLLDVVRELRVDGQDPEKFAPGWLALVNNELASLEGLARRTRTARGSDLSAQYLRLRDDLRKERDEALQGIAAQKAREAIDNLPMNRVPIATAKLIVGAADAIVSPIIETARELYDEAQIGLYYVSGGRYQVKLTSSLMDAFAHGATRTEVLKGMVEGLFGTPGRLIKAAEDGDWESVGKEAMNLYLLAKTIEGSPQYIRRASQILATTRRALRVVRARTLGLRLKAPRLLPEAPLPPREPVFLRHDAAGRPVAGAPRQAPVTVGPTAASSLPAEPTFLKHAGGKGGGAPGAPPGGRPPPPGRPPGDPTRLPERLFELLERPVDRVWSHTPAARAPLPEGEFRVGLTHPIETYRAFNEALAGAGGREVGAFYNELTGEYRVKIGNRLNVTKPEGDGWIFLVHSHPNPLRARTFRLPAPDDFEDLLFRFGNTKSRVREFVEYDVPGVGRWRVEYGFDPGFPEAPQYIRILNHDGTVSEPIRFEHGKYEHFWSSGSVAVNPGSPQHAQFISNSHEWLNDFREQKERGEEPGAKAAVSAPRAYDPSKVRVIRGEVSRTTSGVIDPAPSNGVPERVEPELDDPKGIQGPIIKPRRRRPPRANPAATVGPDLPPPSRAPGPGPASPAAQPEGHATTPKADDTAQRRAAALRASGAVSTHDVINDLGVVGESRLDGTDFVQRITAILRGGVPSRDIETLVPDLVRYYQRMAAAAGAKRLRIVLENSYGDIAFPHIEREAAALKGTASRQQRGRRVEIEIPMQHDEVPEAASDSESDKTTGRGEAVAQADPKTQFRDLFSSLIDAKEPGSIMIEGVGMSGIRVVPTGDGELTFFYSHIKNFGRTPGHGRLMHSAFEEAAKAVGALRGAITVRVAVELVQNPDWAAHLESLGYERMMIQNGPNHFTTVYLRLWKL